MAINKKNNLPLCHPALDAKSISITVNKDRFPLPDQVRNRFCGNDINRKSNLCDSFYLYNVNILCGFDESNHYPNIKILLANFLN